MRLDMGLDRGLKDGGTPKDRSTWVRLIVFIFILLLLCICCRRRGITLSFWLRVAGGTNPVVIFINRSAASIMNRLEAATTDVVWID
jgi:hypothetical protein